MNEDIRDLLRRHRGVITRVDARTVNVPHLVDYAIRAGYLERIYPGVYAATPVDPRTRRRAAIVFSRRRAGLSHTTALAVWGLNHDDDVVHVTTAPTNRFAAEGLVVHRRNGFALDPGHVRYLDGLPVTRLEQSIVDSWPLLAVGQRRDPVIRAVTDRRTTPARLREALDGSPRLRDQAALANLVHLLAIGCHSPLEMWGHDHVFSGPGMPRFRRQVPVRLDDRTVYLDVYAEAEKVNFEVDGTGSHTTLADRERDLRRDAALAALGILVVRFSHHRLVHDAAAVRLEVLAILAARRTSRQ
jgi:very-short-patch-repair endonuclease